MQEAKNKFQRNDEKRAEQRNAAHGVTRSEAVSRRDKAREQWTHSHSNNHHGGLLLDEATLAAKDAATSIDHDDREVARRNNSDLGLRHGVLRVRI
jgi:hypothetical protein